MERRQIVRNLLALFCNSGLNLTMTTLLQIYTVSLVVRRRRNAVFFKLKKERKNFIFAEYEDERPAIFASLKHNFHYFLSY